MGGWSGDGGFLDFWAAALAMRGRIFRLQVVTVVYGLELTERLLQVKQRFAEKDSLETKRDILCCPLHRPMFLRLQFLEELWVGMDWS